MFCRVLASFLTKKRDRGIIFVCRKLSSEQAPAWSLCRVRETAVALAVVLDLPVGGYD